MNRIIPFVLVVAVLAAAGPARAQQRPRWEIPGFDFRRDGAWRALARRVAERRAALLARGDFTALNAPLTVPPAVRVPAPAAQAVSGVLKVPAILFDYLDTPPAQLRDTAAYNAVLFASAPPFGRPYTYRTFYEQLSTGLLSIQGQSYGYAALDSNEVTYVGIPGTCTGNPFGTTNCNGLFSNDAVTRMQNGLTLALRKLDASIDWTQYDSDGDGFVDLVLFIPPARDGACGGATNNHLWSHRFFLLAPFPTHSPAPGGGNEQVADYILQSGVGGDTACDSTAIMPIGTVAHETGHGFGLPDLYDTNGPSEGIGEWGLMGSGNYTSPLSPSRMEAWSLQQLGWITLVPLAATGPYAVGPVPTADTSFLVRPRGANPRGEYFLLENRQGVLADSALIRIHCAVSGNPPGCAGGLLIWHVDSQKIVTGEPGNEVNSGTPHGVALEQADGLDELGSGVDRGDGGDPYPGTAGNTSFSRTTNPAATVNADGSFVGFSIDSIRQVVSGGPMAFRLDFSAFAIVSAPGRPGAVMGAPYTDILQATGGSGPYVWRPVGGALPPGLTLDASGLVFGIPTTTGPFTFAAQVTSSSEQRTQSFTLGVSAPVLVTSAVVAQLLNGAGGGGTLTPSQLTYLDLLGNRNGQFDVGDFLAWVQATGAPVSAGAALGLNTVRRGRP